MDTKESVKNAAAGAKVLILGHKCYRCEHEWRPHDLDEIPVTCPKCKSPYWQKPKEKNQQKVQGKTTKP